MMVKNVASKNPFVTLEPDSELPLPPSDAFPDAGHFWDASEIDALILAYASRRPLLLRGEAGSGKSQLARAAAAVMGQQLPLIQVIHPRFDPTDLLYQFDALQRLADAQSGQITTSNEKYVRKGRLWEAFESNLAAPNRAVLLIDEIDKADSDVPNALLEVLGNRSFVVPPLADLRVTGDKQGMPMILITTNEERELPAAFVRRCVVLNLNPPSHLRDPEAFVHWLVRRGNVHKHLVIDPGVREQAARQVLQDRLDAPKTGLGKVGLAEYIDLLTALHDLTAGLGGAEQAAKQRYWLQRLSAYALVKHSDAQQKRAAVS